MSADPITSLDRSMTKILKREQEHKVSIMVQVMIGESNMITTLGIPRARLITANPPKGYSSSSCYQILPLCRPT